MFDGKKCGLRPNRNILYIGFVKEDQHAKTIDQLLKEIALLERVIAKKRRPEQQEQASRALHLRLKKMDRMIPYPFRRELDSFCHKIGIGSNFLA